MFGLVLTLTPTLLNMSWNYEIIWNISFRDSITHFILKWFEGEMDLDLYQVPVMKAKDDYIDQYS